MAGTECKRNIHLTHRSHNHFGRWRWQSSIGVRELVWHPSEGILNYNLKTAVMSGLRVYGAHWKQRSAGTIDTRSIGPLVFMEVHRGIYRKQGSRTTQDGRC